MTSIARSTLRRLLVELCKSGEVAVRGAGRARTYVRRAGCRVPAVAEMTARLLLKEHGVVRRRDFVAATWAAPRTAKRKIDELVRRGVLRPNGRRGRAAGYVAG